MSHILGIDVCQVVRLLCHRVRTTCSADYDVAMLLDRLLSDLALTLRPFAVCEIAFGWRLRLDKVDWVTVHFVVSGGGRLRAADGVVTLLRRHTLALVPAKPAAGY